MTSVNGDSKTKRKKTRDSSPSSSPSSPASSSSDKDDNHIRRLSDEDRELIRKKRNLVSESMLTVVECVYENYISSIRNELAVRDTEQLWQEEVEPLFRDAVKKRVIEPFEAVMEANITDEVRSPFFIDNHKPIEDLFLKSMDMVMETARSSKNAHLFVHVLKELRPRLRDSIKKAKYCCDCVTNYFKSATDNFFEMPCTRPHTLVWAKTKGCPFWPAKLIGVRQKRCTVLYFGGHEIDEQIPLFKSNILRLTRKYPSGRDMKEIENNRQLAKAYQEAMKQLKGHIDLLKKEYGESVNVYAPESDSTLHEDHPIYYKVRHLAPVTPHESQRVEERNDEQYDEQDDEKGLNIPTLRKAEDFWIVAARHRVPSSLLNKMMSSEHFDIRVNPFLSANVWFKPEERAKYMKSLPGCFRKDVCQSGDERQPIVIHLVPTSSSSVEEVHDLPHNRPSPSKETVAVLPSVVSKEKEEDAPSEKPKKRQSELVEDSESHTLPEHNLPQSNKKLKISHEEKAHDETEKRPHKTLQKKQDMKKFDSKSFTKEESETSKHHKSDSKPLKKEDDIRKSDSKALPRKDSDGKHTKSDVKLLAPSPVDNPQKPRQNKGHNSAFGDFLVGLDEVNKLTFLRKPSLKKVEIKEKGNKPGDQEMIPAAVVTKTARTMSPKKEMKSDSREDLIEKARKLRVDFNRSQRFGDQQAEICRRVNEKNNQSKVGRLQKEHEAEMQNIHQDLAILSDQKEFQVKLLAIKKLPHCFECSSPLDQKIKWSQIDLDPEVNCVVFSHLNGFGHYFCSKTCRQDSFAVHKGPCKYCTTKVYPPSKTTT